MSKNDSKTAQGTVSRWIIAIEKRLANHSGPHAYVLIARAQEEPLRDVVAAFYEIFRIAKNPLLDQKTALYRSNLDESHPLRRDFYAEWFLIDSETKDVYALITRADTEALDDVRMLYEHLLRQARRDADLGHEYMIEEVLALRTERNDLRDKVAALEAAQKTSPDLVLAAPIDGRIFDVLHSQLATLDKALESLRDVAVTIIREQYEDTGDDE